MADKILIVDDDPAICKLLEKVMHSNELETTTVNCGMDALSILKNHTFDLILMDIQMPVMNGYDSTRHIRALERPDIKSMPIIAMSANAFAEDIKLCKESGMNEHIAKPIDFGKVLEILEKYL